MAEIEGNTQQQSNNSKTKYHSLRAILQFKRIWSTISSASKHNRQAFKITISLFCISYVVKMLPRSASRTKAITWRGALNFQILKMGFNNGEQCARDKEEEATEKRPSKEAAQTRLSDPWEEIWIWLIMSMREKKWLSPAFEKLLKTGIHWVLSPCLIK